MSSKDEWDDIERSLMMRSGSRCEIRSPECLGVTTVANGTRLEGFIGHLRRGAAGGPCRSFHHRRPRGMGGTRRADVDSLAALVNTCGDGTTGCHYFTESYRRWGFDRGLLVPNHGTALATDPALVPLILPSGRRVMLDPDFPWYNTPPAGPTYVNVPLPEGFA